MDNYLRLHLRYLIKALSYREFSSQVETVISQHIATSCAYLNMGGKVGTPLLELGPNLGEPFKFLVETLCSEKL